MVQVSGKIIMTRTSILTEHLAVHPYATLDVTDLSSQSDALASHNMYIGMITGKQQYKSFLTEYLTTYPDYVASNRYIHYLHNFHS